VGDPLKKPFVATPFARPIAPQQKRVPLNVLFGLPDDRRAQINLVDDGRRLSFDLPGTIDLVTHLPRERFAAEVVYLQPGQKQPARLRPGALVNHIGDPDICSQALEAARQIVRKSGRPCFNHPDAIGATTRDGVARTLRGIPGLDVPKTIRIAAPTPKELRAAAEREGLEYPILVRVAGAHGGTNMVKIDKPDAAEDIDRLDRSTRAALYATEFRDFAGRDGLYRKFRIVMVGDAMFLRQMIVGEGWLIHARRRAADTRNEELDLFASFKDTHAARLEPIFQEIARRLDLDFFGVDCAIDDAGVVVLFEANACMKILEQTQKSSNVKAQTIAEINKAVQDRLASPTTWRQRQRASVS
jgi:glutathione synthase/RimK-type ligase-like ATP-grasp enzyme